MVYLLLEVSCLYTFLPVIVPFYLPKTLEDIICKTVSTKDTDGKITGQRLQSPSFKNVGHSSNYSAAEFNTNLVKYIEFMLSLSVISIQKVSHLYLVQIIATIQNRRKNTTYCTDRHIHRICLEKKVECKDLNIFVCAATYQLLNVI